VSATLSEAALARVDHAIDQQIDAFIDERLKAAKLAAPISTHAKVKLRGILKKYAKEEHPFRACVRDNMVRFGPGRTEAVCATLKDTIKGRKDWRKGGKAKLDGEIDGEVLLALDAISEHDLQTVFLQARALDEYGTAEASVLLEETGAGELKRWGDLPVRRPEKKP
jgi:hypothetical protein